MQKFNIIFSDYEPQKSYDKKTIFLAGPSPRTQKIRDWRDDAFKVFEKAGFDGTLFVPRPEGGNMESYDGQVEWELYHLEKADVIMFWVPRKFPELKGLTTNVEFGLFMKKEIVYGRPYDAESVKYLDYIYEKFKKRKPNAMLLTTIEEAIKMVSN